MNLSEVRAPATISSMIRRSCIFVLVILLISGCGQRDFGPKTPDAKTESSTKSPSTPDAATPTSKPEPPKPQQKAKEEAPPKKEASGGNSPLTEEEAKEKVKLVLDSWVFGDDLLTFGQQHPEINTGAVLNSMYRLARYEIGPSRKTALGYEFSVTHVFESNAGTEIKRTGNVSVWKTKGNYMIQGLGGGN